MDYPITSFDQTKAIDRLQRAHTQGYGGQIEPDAPEGVLIINDYLDKATCAMLMAYADSQEGTPSLVMDDEKSTEHAIVSVKSDTRVAQSIAIDGKVGDILNIFNDICCKQLATFFDVDFEWYERPEMLRYPKGGKYAGHADAEYWSRQKREWVRGLDRDFSAVVYLNSDFEGGEFHLSKQLYTVKPRPGMLVGFPSDHRYVHKALPTIEGVRYALVSWGATMGSARVRAQMPKNCVYLRQKRGPS